MDQQFAPGQRRCGGGVRLADPRELDRQALPPRYEQGGPRRGHLRHLPGSARLRSATGERPRYTTSVDSTAAIDSVRTGAIRPGQRIAVAPIEVRTGSSLQTTRSPSAGSLYTTGSPATRWRTSMPRPRPRDGEQETRSLTSTAGRPASRTRLGPPPRLGLVSPPKGSLAPFGQNDAIGTLRGEASDEYHSAAQVPYRPLLRALLGVCGNRGLPPREDKED